MDRRHEVLEAAVAAGIVAGTGSLVCLGAAGAARAATPARAGPDTAFRDVSKTRSEPAVHAA